MNGLEIGLVYVLGGIIILSFWCGFCARGRENKFLKKLKYDR